MSIQIVPLPQTKSVVIREGHHSVLLEGDEGDVKQVWHQLGVILRQFKGTER